MNSQRIRPRVVGGIAITIAVGFPLGLLLADGGDQLRGDDEQEISALEAINMGHHASQPARSILDVAQSAQVIAEVHVESVGEPRWNSRDGRPWMTEYELDPNRYERPPMIMTQAAVRVDAFIYRSDSADPIAVADTIEIEVPDDPSLARAEERAGVQIPAPQAWGYLSEGSSRVLFLYRTPFPYPEEAGPLVWKAFTRWSIWGTERGVAIPAMFDHQDELKSLASSYDVVKRTDGTLGLRREDLQGIAESR